MIDRLAANGIDLTKMPVEVAPIAHYHMGGVGADVRMQTEVPGLLVAGEAVGGANGANRLSGNAITEALVFGREAGRTAAARAAADASRTDCGRRRGDTLDLMRGDGANGSANTAAMVQTPASRPWPTTSARCAPVTELQTRARNTLMSSSDELGDRPFGGGGAFDLQRLDWFDLRNMLIGCARR